MRKIITVCCFWLAATLAVGAQDSAISGALTQAGDNAKEIQRALDAVPEDQRPGMEFLIQNMPERDLQSLTAEFLLENVELAYQSWRESSWKVPADIFLNYLLPYASINEKRDNYRKPFRERFSPLVKDARSAGEAAAILNNQIFSQLQVKYSRKRRRADQGPFESIESGLASCTGLSVLLIDACRSVGVPARFVGTPLWSDGSGNHSWVEVWDNGWHFTGAAEPTGNELDQAWFVQRSSLSQRDNPRHAIYAASFKKTPLHFPLVWAPSTTYISAVNVTDRYAGKAKELPPDHLLVMFRVNGVGGERCCTSLRVEDAGGKVLFEGQTKDESFDGNDHLAVPLPVGATFEVILGDGRKETISTDRRDSQKQLFTFEAK